MVLVGRVVKPHGLSGHVVVHPETDFVQQRYAPGSLVWTRRGDAIDVLTVAGMRLQGGRPVVRFDGLERIEDIEQLIGCELRIPEASLQPLEPGHYYEHQLTGCAVVLRTGEQIGTVVRVQGGAGASYLIVEGPRGEILIPFVQPICPVVDVVGRMIRIEPPEGLLDVNRRR